MPRKKKEEEITNKIINWYEKIPEELLDKTPNPNYHLHHLKISMRGLIVSPSGGFKSNLICNLLYLFGAGEGTFQTIHLICKTADEPLYKFLQLKCPRIVIKEGMENIPDLNKMDKAENHLVIFDDMCLEKNQKPIENFYQRCRKKNCSVLYLSQSYYMTPIFIRKNLNYLFILKLNGLRDIKSILSENGLGITNDQLLKMYQYCVETPMTPLIVDFAEQPEKRFRKGFDEILNPSLY